MNSDQNRSAVSPGGSRSVGRPPYGLPLRGRPRLLDASDSLGWRRYSTPVPPERSPLRGWYRAARLVLIAGFLACVGAGLWSSSWGANGSSPRTTVASMPTSRPIISERAVVLAVPSTSTSAHRTPPPAPRTRPSPKVSKNKAISSGNRYRSMAPAEPRQHQSPVLRRNPTTRIDRVEESRRLDREHGGKERVVPLVVAKCDELFPPSRPEFRIRNRACHLIFEQRATSEAEVWSRGSDLR
jgi:hypothetical protein